MSGFLSDTLYGATTGDSLLVRGWSLSNGTDATAQANNRFKLGVDAQADFGSSRSVSIASGANQYAVRHSSLTIGVNEKSTAIVAIDRFSSGLYHHTLHFCVVDAAGIPTAGYAVTIRRVASGNNRVAVAIDILGGTADPAPVTDGIHDGHNWFYKAELSWDDSTTARIRVYALEAGNTWLQIHSRVITSAPVTSGIFGMYSLGTGSAGRAYLNRLLIATGSAPWACIMRPYHDSTPFARSEDPNDPQQLLVEGYCGNVSNGDVVQGKFVPNGEAEGDYEWQDIATLTAGQESWSGTIQAEVAPDTVGTVMVRHGSSATFIDSLQNCKICWVWAFGGQSNTGRATNKQALVPANGVNDFLCWPAVLVSETADPSVRRYWRTLTTEDSGSGGETVVFGSSYGSPFPKLAQKFAEAGKGSCSFIGWGLGTTGLVGGGTWASGGTEWLRLVYNLQASGVTKFNGFIWIQGENEVQTSATEAQYLSAFHTMITDLELEIGRSIGRIFMYTLGFEFYGSIDTDTKANNQMAPILAAQVGYTKIRVNTHQGGFVRLIDLSLAAEPAGGGVHFSSDTNVDRFATYYFQAMMDAIFPSEGWGGPKCTAVYWLEKGSQYRMKFDEPIALYGAAASFTGVRTEVNGVSVACTAVAGFDFVDVTLTSPSATGDIVRSIYPDGNEVADGVGVTGKYIADAVDGTRPAFAVVETVTDSGLPTSAPSRAVMAGAVEAQRRGPIPRKAGGFTVRGRR